jgi:hypothetical protein
LEARLIAARQMMTENHPDVAALKRELDKQRKIQSERE